MAGKEHPTPSKNSEENPSPLINMSLKKSKQRRWISLGAVLLMISGGAGVSWKLLPGTKSTRDVTEYTVAAESGTLPELITASGELQAERNVNVSPERQGLLDELYVDEGHRVNEGQVLAKMDSGDYFFRLEELKTDYETNKAAFERREKLFSEGAISAEERDEYLNRFLTSKSKLQQRQVEGSDLYIRAPFNGVITARYAEPGSFVAPTTRASSNAGSTSTSIVELSQGLEVIAKVPESDIGRIRIGQQSSVRVDAFPDQRFQAKVSEVAPRAEKTDNVTSFEVTLILTKRSPKLRIGMTADVNFQAGETEQSTLVPTVAIVTENGKPGVLLVGQNNQPRFQTVELGTSSGSKTAILKGLEPGTPIFIDLPPWARSKRN